MLQNVFPPIPKHCNSFAKLKLSKNCLINGSSHNYKVISIQGNDTVSLQKYILTISCMMQK